MQKNIFKGKGTFKVSVSDTFFSIKFSGTFESHQFKTTLTWRFGSNTVKAANKRKDASEEEKKRTKSSGGFGSN